MHLQSCTTRKELTGGIWVHYSQPDVNCTDKSHHDSYTEEVK